jgi:AraC family transcriptional regulator of adaptative response / DNA-3-methyladenine glycosylase II
MNEVPGLTRAALHRARISRDARFDGKFYIAVLTTGVYCRPICPSPCSRKSHVRYYATAAEAAAAGYRPCRRCRPEVAPGTPAWLGPSAVVRRALRLIQEGALDGRTVEELALRLGVGARHLGRLFAEHVGVSPVAVAQTRRLHFAKQLLDETSLPITQLALTAGFGSLRRFNEAFRAAFRCTPSALRRRSPGRAATARDERVSLTLPYRPPYDWDYVAAFLARRALGGIEQVSAGGYLRTLRLPHGYARLQVGPVLGEHALRLQVWRAEPSDLFEIAVTARRVFDLAADPAAIAAVLSADPLLLPLVRQRPGLRIPGVWCAFECAVRALLAWRTGVPAARRLGERLVERFGERIAAAPDGATHLFPSPETLAEANLGVLGLTASKTAALRALARAVSAGELNLAGPADEFANTLGAVPDLGRWVAQYVALRALGEPDTLPCDNLLLRRLCAARGSSTLTARALEERAGAWRPWRGYAALHLWQSEAEPSAAGIRSHGVASAHRSRRRLNRTRSAGVVIRRQRETSIGPTA